MVRGVVNTIERETAVKEAKQKPILEQTEKDYQRDRMRFDQTAKDYGPVETTPAPKAPTNDPLAGFASAAGIFAQIAAAFTHTPAVAAMNGMAAAIQGAKQGKWEQYEAGYKEWKSNTEVAIQKHKLQADDMRTAMEMMKENLAAGVARAKAVAAQSDDHIATALLEAGQYEKLDQVMRARQTAAMSMQEHALKVEDMNLELQDKRTKRKLETDLAAARQSGDPDRVKAAEVAVRDHWTATNAAYSRPMFQGARTPIAMALAKFQEQNPDATAEAIRDFVVGFKEDAPKNAERKDRAQAEKERHNATLEGIQSDHYDNEQDRQKARDAEIARHNKATESINTEKAKNVSPGVQIQRDRQDQAAVAFQKKFDREPDLGNREDRAQLATIKDEIVAQTKADTAREVGKARLDSNPKTREWSTRFAEAKAEMQAAGTYVNDSSIYDKINRDIFLSKSSHFAPGVARLLAEQIVGGNAAAASGFGRAPALMAELDNEVAKLAAERGLHGEDLNRLKVNYAAYSQGVKAFEAGGKLEPPTRSLSVVVDHLGTFQEAVDAMANGDLPLFNKIANSYGRETGLVANMKADAVRDVIVHEIEKAISNSAGAVQDRESLRDSLKTSSSPTQLQSVVQGYQELMGGQLSGLRSSYNRVQDLGGNKAPNFDTRFLSPRARQALERGDTSAGGQRHQVGDEIMQGGKKYRVTAVGADGKPTAANEVQ